MSLIGRTILKARPTQALCASYHRTNFPRVCFSTIGKTQATPTESVVSSATQASPEPLRSAYQPDQLPLFVGGELAGKMPPDYVRWKSKVEEPSIDLTPLKLREACTCTKCVDPTDQQRHFVFADIPTDITIAESTVDADGNHVIKWQNDIPGYSDHISRYTKEQFDYVSKPHTSPVTEYGSRPKTTWTAQNYDVAAHTVSYDDYMNDDTALARLLHLVSKYGLAFIDNIPGQAESVNKMAERVGPLRTTFYGETWDVKSMPNATNVAYTSRELTFHMDMLYVREPPGLQFLHCIESTCDGGESRFADTYAAADRLMAQMGPASFDALRSMNVKYHYSRPGTSTSAIKPVFDTKGHEDKPPHNFTNAETPDLLNQIHRIYWSPPFTGRALGNDPHAAGENVVAGLQASKVFHELLNEPSSVIETKVPPGTCAVFDNFRVVHARRAFDLNSGHRWLRVSYVDDADYWSRAVTLRNLMPKV